MTCCRPSGFASLVRDNERLGAIGRARGDARLVRSGAAAIDALERRGALRSWDACAAAFGPAAIHWVHLTVTRSC